MMAVGEQSSVVGEQSSVVANLIRQKVFITSVYNKAIATAAVACGWAGTVMWGRGGGGAVYTRASVTCDWAGVVMQKSLTEYMCDGLTNGPMDGPTDRPTERPTE